MWQLVDRAREGDREAFGQLYDQYHGKVYRYLLWRSGSVHLAEDLTADTFIRALRAIRSFTYRGRDPGGWFTAIARNLFLDHVKAAKTRLEVSSGAMTLTWVDDAGAPGVGARSSGVEEVDPGPGPEDRTVGTLTAAEAMRAVRTLVADQQECVILRIFEGLSVAETAAVMGRSHGAVKALQHRAIGNLAARLPGGKR